MWKRSLQDFSPLTGYSCSVWIVEPGLLAYLLRNRGREYIFNRQLQPVIDNVGFFILATLWKMWWWEILWIREFSSEKAISGPWGHTYWCRAALIIYIAHIISLVYKSIILMAPIAKYTLNRDWHFLMRWLMLIDSFWFSYYVLQIFLSFFIPMLPDTADSVHSIAKHNGKRIPKPKLSGYDVCTQIDYWLVRRSGTAQDLTVFFLLNNIF